MKQKLSDPHQQFASFFKDATLQSIVQRLSLNLEKGSICVDLSEEEQKDLEFDDFIGSPEGLAKPFIRNQDKIYLRRYFNYESIIINRLKEFVSSSDALLQDRAMALSKSNHFQNLQKNRDRSLKQDWQLVAAALAYLQDFCIITGGPGTGKTTTVAKVLTLLWGDNPDLNVKLAAPTGKAAMRMSESLQQNKNIPEELKPNFEKVKSSTIHRLLGAKLDSPYFRHHKGNPLDVDVLIIDEASMIDVALFAKLMDAIGPNTRLILLGDQNQLASVEAGSIFGDLCNTVEDQNFFSLDLKTVLDNYLENVPSTATTSLLQNHLVSLSHSYRFNADEHIGKLSKAIIQSDRKTMDNLMALNGTMEQVSFDFDHDEEVLKKIARRYVDYIEEQDIEKALYLFNRQRVLAAIKLGKQGVYQLNQRIQGYLYGWKKLTEGGEFYQHRPVMVTQNDNSLGLFNGDIGIVRKNEAGETRVYFLDGQKGLKSVSPSHLTHVETVFAMTIHKSQGSEFEQVLCVLPKQGEMELLTGELLYTAVTRAKKQVLIQGSAELIFEAMEKKVKRASGIKERLS